MISEEGSSQTRETAKFDQKDMACGNKSHNSSSPEKETNAGGLHMLVKEEMVLAKLRNDVPEGASMSSRK